MKSREAYFILADITGFTSFVADTELDHSQEILSKILNFIVDNFIPQFTLAEIEGDAVFLYAPVEKFSRGEIIMEMIESSYYTFRDTKSSFRRLINCNCRACEMVSKLDLKFIVHSGDFVLNNVAGKLKPMGTAVNTLHRLAKNKVSESTGWGAYVLFTKECLENLGLNFSNTHFQTENYEHLGNIDTFSINLDDQYKKFAEDRIVFIAKEDADYYVERDYLVVPSVMWEWVNNPVKRSLWLEVTDWNPVSRPFGRTGKGATNHCANSNFFEYLLDYRPFDYYTSEIKSKNVTFRMTGKFKGIPQGTKFIWLVKMQNKLPALIKKLYCMIILKNGLKIDKALNKLNELLQEEKSAGF